MIIKKVYKILLVILCLPIILCWAIICGDVADITLLIKGFISDDKKLLKDDIKRMTR